MYFSTSRKKFATPSVHFYKSFQTTEIDLLCTLSEISSTPYKSEQREYNLTISSILFSLEEHMEACAEREAWIDLRLMTCVYMLIAQTSIHCLQNVPWRPGLYVSKVPKKQKKGNIVKKNGFVITLFVWHNTDIITILQ